MGNPFCHMELTADDLSAAKKFYGKLFDWKLQDMPMGPGQSYTMVGVGKGVGGGMQARPMPQAPTGWHSYVEVDSVKRSIAKAAKLGANIMLEYQAIGGGMGAIGIFADPQGSILGVWEKSAPVKKGAAKKGAAKKGAAKKTAAKSVAKKGAKKKKK